MNSTSEFDYTSTDTSSDPDGAIVAWEWDFGDGNTSTEQNPVYACTSSGEFTISLTAIDNRGVHETTTQAITADVAPVADFTGATEELQAVFTDTSSDLNGQIVGWERVGDGATSTEQSPTHIYTAEGNVTVSLTVTDDLGPKTTVAKSLKSPKRAEAADAARALVAAPWERP